MKHRNALGIYCFTSLILKICVKGRFRFVVWLKLFQLKHIPSVFRPFHSISFFFQIAYEIQAVNQSSTNGSYVAALGCDGEMDTFSLTNDGDNESWSVILDKVYRIIWIFVRIKAGNFFFINS